ncbi:hypothetical protein [Bradyrhizobium sp.]|uniref:hypothetical protein n=1 Tax=Bradyrhizobium sp. TaxID=376 RepID=UPI00273712A0|nr:hypothetical protein [Bradyrhizobium sp.]MDP3074478.1 hypothetical protein [Bradyrhizobium sp.]
MPAPVPLPYVGEDAVQVHASSCPAGNFRDALSQRGRALKANCRTISIHRLDGQITSVYRKTCQAPRAKIFLFYRIENQAISLRIPSHQEGRFANVTDAGRDAVDAAARETGDAEAYGQVVWS